MTEITSDNVEKPAVDILVLGAGWLYQFLHPELTRCSISHAGTTRDGHDNTIPFNFDPSSADPTPYRLLPRATTILITFPLLGSVAPRTLQRLYATAHPTSSPHYILLGSTGEYQGPGWHDHTSSPAKDPPSPRWQAETTLLSLGGCVLNLSGLMGEAVRDSKIWARAVPRCKEDIRSKTSVHFIHGADIARAVVAVHRNPKTGTGRRWLLTDGRVYDWWDLIWANAEQGLDARPEAPKHGGYRKWVAELMREEGVRALPRDGEVLGRRLDSRAFWEAFELVPLAKGFRWADPPDDDARGHI